MVHSGSRHVRPLQALTLPVERVFRVQQSVENSRLAIWPLPIRARGPAEAKALTRRLEGLALVVLAPLISTAIRAQRAEQAATPPSAG